MRHQKSCTGHIGCSLALPVKTGTPHYPYKYCIPPPGVIPTKVYSMRNEAFMLTFIPEPNGYCNVTV